MIRMRGQTPNTNHADVRILNMLNLGSPRVLLWLCTFHPIYDWYEAAIIFSQK